ncbi:D-2-hydroxyacid dehydrogenase [Helicobacter jaachi]|uniref:D-2-hydroxyacid dehydrogenase n=1 Tax=Helicobacter jaachi TaxID=1677920 RepID=A0A4U8TCC3_9HELI|nr:D-2-hydroxyacid dehydrogenase [Helicobacter jaachi]TLD97585.1 D-2-hydroxyacid dehydrogenase [Helicobacter jaachi]
MNIVILDADTLGECDLSQIEALGDVVSYGFTESAQALERCREADIIITNKVILNEALLKQLNKLKLICITATGTNNVDLDYAAQRGIVVKNVAGYSTDSVAQHTLSLVLHFLAYLSYYDNYCKSGEWCESKVFAHIHSGMRELKGLQWGIIGFGNIGQEVARLAQCFGANVSYHSTSGKNTQQSITHKSLEQILSQSDIISIHAPLNTHTHNLINATNLPLLKDNCILINVGRGGIVNERDIAAFLRTKSMFFGTDVLENEPMKPNHPFLDKAIAPKILLTPHIAWAYEEARAKLLSLTAQNIREFLG